MEIFEAAIDSDGTCRYVELSEYGEPVETTWPSVAAWVQAWIAEQRSTDVAEQIGPAWQFIDRATDQAMPGVVDVLVELAEAVADDEDLIVMVGCGPLEDLISHSGNGARVFDYVDRAARRSAPFREALGSVYLGDGIPEHVTKRLVELRADAR